jgi:hypothetical protein
MSIKEILEELPKLTPEERQEIRDFLDAEEFPETDELIKAVDEGFQSSETEQSLSPLGSPLNRTVRPAAKSGAPSREAKRLKPQIRSMLFLNGRANGFIGGWGSNSYGSIHGEVERGRKRNGENYRPRLGKDTGQIGF